MNDSDTTHGDKIAKVLAHAGIASRRQAEAMVRTGRVAVGGETISDPAVRVPRGETVTVDGRPITRQTEVRLWRYHKPPGQVVTHRDPQGRPTVFDALPRGMPRVISVGRLDLNSEGLLLLTNDGDLARWLELPATGWKRRYRVRAFGTLPPDMLTRLAAGLVVDGVKYGPIEVTVDRKQGDNLWLSVGLREGRNREVRRVLAHFGLKVNRLIRLSYGPFQLGHLPRGDVEEVPGKILREQAAPFFRDKGGEDARIRKRHARRRRPA